jgi:hypothetical protein
MRLVVADTREAEVRLLRAMKQTLTGFLRISCIARLIPRAIPHLDERCGSASPCPVADFEPPL